MFERGYKYLLQLNRLSARLSVDLGMYIKVVPGEFDDLLSWPCKEKVRVTLADQDSETLKITEVIDFDKGKKPCSRSLCDNYHDERKVLAKKVRLFTPGSNWKNVTILIRVNRE